MVFNLLINLKVRGKQYPTTNGNIKSAGHHGSNTSSTDGFLNAVGPQVIAISSGADNSYGHPHAQVLERCRDMGIRVFRTDTDGTAAFGSDGKDFWRVES